MSPSKKHAMPSKNQFYLSLFICVQCIVLIGIINWISNQINTQKNDYQHIIAQQQTIVQNMERNVVIAAQLFLEPSIATTQSDVLGITDTNITVLDTLHNIVQQNKQYVVELEQLKAQLERMYVSNPFHIFMPDITHLTTRTYYPAHYKQIMDYLDISLVIMQEMSAYDMQLHEFVHAIHNPHELSQTHIEEYQAMVVAREQTADRLRALDVSHFSPVVQEEHAVIYHASLGCDARYDEVIVAMDNNDFDAMHDIIEQHEREELFMSQQAREELVSHWFNTINDDTLLLLKKQLAHIEEQMKP